MAYDHVSWLINGRDVELEFQEKNYSASSKKVVTKRNAQNALNGTSVM